MTFVEVLEGISQLHQVVLCLTLHSRGHVVQVVSHGSQRCLLKMVVVLELFNRIEDGRRNAVQRCCGYGLEPRMLLCLQYYLLCHYVFFTCDPFRWVDLQQRAHKVLGFLAQFTPVPFWKRNVIDRDLIEWQTCHLWRKRVVAREEEVGDHSDRPHVATLVVAHTLEIVHVHFRSYVVARSHQTVHIVRIVYKLGMNRWKKAHLA